MPSQDSSLCLDIKSATISVMLIKPTSTTKSLKSQLTCSICPALRLAQMLSYCCILGYVGLDVRLSVMLCQLLCYRLCCVQLYIMLGNVMLLQVTCQVAYTLQDMLGCMLCYVRLLQVGCQVMLGQLICYRLCQVACCYVIVLLYT